MEERGVYAPITLILSFLERLAETLEWNDFLDERVELRQTAASLEKSTANLESFCMYNTVFKPFFQDIIRPFLSDMSAYHEKVDFYYGLEEYKQMYKPQQLERIRHFLLDLAQFLREIPYHDEIKTNLCQNIAFAVESMCGLYDPLESLFEKATPIFEVFVGGVDGISLENLKYSLGPVNNV